MGSGVIINNNERVVYDIAKFSMPSDPNLPVIEIRIVNDDNYGDINNLEYIIDVLNAGYKAKWNRDTCMWDLIKDGSMEG